MALRLRFAGIIDRVSCELDLFPKLGLAGLEKGSWEYCNLTDKPNPDIGCEWVQLEVGRNWWGASLVTIRYDHN